MAETCNTFARSQAQRGQAELAAARAAQAWLDVVSESLVDLVAACGVEGPDVLVVLEGAVQPGDDVDGGREQLSSLTVASATARCTVRAGNDERWFEAVEVWDHLRRAAQTAFVAEIPVGLAVDLDGGIVTCWEPAHCPEEGPRPEFSFSLVDRDVPTWEMDPLDALLAAAEQDAEYERGDEEWTDRVVGLLAAYGVAAPSQPFDETDLDEEFESDDDSDFESDSDGDWNAPFAA